MAEKTHVAKLKAAAKHLQMLKQKRKANEAEPQAREVAVPKLRIPVKMTDDSGRT